MPFEWLCIWISTDFHKTASKQTRISEISDVNSSTTSYRANSSLRQIIPLSVFSWLSSQFWSQILREHDLLQLFFEHSSLLLLWHLSQIFSWLLNLMWSCILRENAMPQSFLETKPLRINLMERNQLQTLYSTTIPSLLLCQICQPIAATHSPRWLLLQCLDNQTNPFSVTTSSWLSS